MKHILLISILIKIISTQDNQVCTLTGYPNLDVKSNLMTIALSDLSNLLSI